MEEQNTLLYLLIVGGVFVGIVALLGGVLLMLQIISYWRKLTTPPAPGTQSVTRAELDAQSAALKTDIQHVESDLKTEVKRVESDVKAEVKRVETALIGQVGELRSYVRESTHKLREDLGAMALKAETAKAETAKQIRDMVDQAVKPVAEKLDKHTEALARIEAKINSNPMHHESV